MACRIILASQSPRRKQLLEQVGLQFEVMSADIDESVLPNEHVDDYVLRVAITKAESIAFQQKYHDALVIAADTTVTIDGEILTKPKNYDDAVRMWTLLSGRMHEVKTTVVIACTSVIRHVTVSSKIYFKVLTQDEMFAYWQTGEPHDKAGGYAIQGRAAAWVKCIEGSYSGVVGLPLYETLQLLKKITKEHFPESE